MKTQKYLRSLLVVLAAGCLSSVHAVSVNNVTFRLTQADARFRTAPVTSFSLAGLGLDGGGTAFKVFKIDLSSDSTVTNLQVRIIVKLNDREIYRARSNTFSLAPGVSLPTLDNIIFFRHNGSHPAEWGKTEFKLDETSIAKLGLTNLISAPSGKIRIDAELYQTNAASVVVSPSGDVYAEYNIVTIPEITLLAPEEDRAGLNSTLSGLPLFRWKSLLDEQPGIAGNKYRLSIYAPGSFSGGSVTGRPMFSKELATNYYQYTANDPEFVITNTDTWGRAETGVYAWRVTALLQGPGMAQDAYDERLQSELRSLKLVKGGFLDIIPEATQVYISTLSAGTSPSAMVANASVALQEFEKDLAAGMVPDPMTV